MCSAGVAEATLTLETGTDTTGLLQVLGRTYPGLECLLPRCGLAHNGEYVRGVQPLAAGDEVALIPPVSGG